MHTSERFSTLDGLRGVAAIIVMQMHSKAWFGGVPLQHGNLAVDFFFMLSGFVIAHAYGARIRQGLSFKDYAVTRLVRLYPIYFVGILLTIWLMFARGRPVTIEMLAAAALWLPVFSWPKPAWFVPSSWSLFFELIANAFYFHLAKGELSNRVLIAFVAIGLALVAYCAHIYGHLNFGFRWSHAIVGFARVGFAFGVGVLLYQNRHQFRFGFRHAGLVCAAALVVLAWVPTRSGVSGWYELIVIAIAFPAIIAVCHNDQPNARLSSVYDWLGRISYPLYITHYVIFGLIDELAKATGFGPIGPALGIGIYAALIALSSALDSFYDAPVRKILTRRFGSARYSAESARDDTVISERL